ncbi:MAG: flagellar hook-length control protein FliK [Lachnospiraceae bacterium]|nr:flagellar hook-length control protein FliK [Lachnospiraceae bacterium]
MILSDFFPGAQFKNTSTQRSNNVNTSKAGSLFGRSSESSASHALQSLKPGQTLQGEVVSKDGNQVQIRLEDDSVVEAKVDRDMNLQSGKTMTFEVRSNGQSLTLSPLFENTATQANALKALDMASIPANQTTVTMTGLMMEAGLPVDRSSLQQMFREVNHFPDAGLSNLVDLHKLGLAVNEENLTQIDSYKNLTHQLVEGMHTVLDSMPETLGNMVSEGNVEGAARMFQDMLDMIGELQGEIGASEHLPDDPSGGVSVDGRTMAADTLAGSNAGKVVITENGVVQEAVLEIGQETDQTAQGSGATQAGNGLQGEMSPQNISADGQVAVSAMTDELLQLIKGGADGDNAYAPLVQQFAEALQNGGTADQAKALQQLVQQGLQDKNNSFLEGLMSGKGAQKVLADGFSKLWTIEPKEVADSNKVEELYSRLNRQLNHLSHALEQNGQEQSQAFKAVTNMNQNIDFLQQLNQAYTYVQLPLRLQQGDAHGDLYVYTNKRNLASKDGQISALLHLDMENLGPVDVYVAMQAEKVNTRFYVKDDEMLDFLEEHMDLLTERLQKRGYNCSFAMQTRGENAAPESGLKGLLDGPDGQQAKTIAQYAFDVRA